MKTYQAHGQDLNMVNQCGHIDKNGAAGLYTARNIGRAFLAYNGTFLSPQKLQGMAQCIVSAPPGLSILYRICSRIGCNVASGSNQG